MFQSISDSIFRPVKENGEIAARPQRTIERKTSPCKENGNVNITHRPSSKHSSKSGKSINPADSTITAEEKNKTNNYIKSLRDEVSLKDAGKARYRNFQSSEKFFIKFFICLRNVKVHYEINHAIN